MKYSLPTLLLGVMLLSSCHRDQPTPDPSLEGTWLMNSYDYNQPGFYGQREVGTVAARPNNFIIISGQAIEYHDPALSAVITQTYTRQATNLHIAVGTLNSRVETITKLTNQDLVLHITRPAQVGFLLDSMMLDYHYTRQ